MFKKLLSLLLLMAMLVPGAIALAEEQDDAAEEKPILWKLAEPYGFKIGTTYNFGSIMDPGFKNGFVEQFNTLTCSNETKAYSMLDQRASQTAEDGMPVINFKNADMMLSFAQARNITVRGHVLVWDAYMPDWFFRQGYQYGAELVDRETMCARLKSYIEQVVSHFEEKFPGVIDRWDVVNEAIGDNASEWDASTPRHIRTVRSGVTNYFRDVIGDDYVELSFLYARDAAEKAGADIGLFYNDYNMFYDEKRTAALALVESINNYATDEDGNPRKLIDGIGMQGYIGGYGHQQGCMNPNDLALIKKSIEAYAAMGMEVNMTEIAVRNYQNDEESVKKHAEYYAKLFEIFKEVNSGENKPLTVVNMWGAVDCSNLPETHYSWKLNSPYGGLFDVKYNPKSAYDAVVEVLKAQ